MGKKRDSVTSNDRDKIIGERIGAARSAYGESQRDLAAALGNDSESGRVTVTRWENGERAVHAGHFLYEIAARYGVSADYLLGLTDCPSTDKDLQFVCDYTGLSEEAIKTCTLINSSRLFGADIAILSRFISDYSQSFCIHLTDIYNTCKEISDKISRSDFESPMPAACYDSLRSFDDAIGLSLYRFNRLCESIPQHLAYDIGELIIELSAIEDRIMRAAARNSDTVTEETEGADYGND